MEKSYRLRTDVGKDQVVKAKFKQDIDFLEILSLKIRQTDAYQLHVSNYGMIVGRVLANNAFGIQNAKVSVFIPISEEDSKNSEIFNLYPYSSIYTLDNENRRYNLLPSSSNDECYKTVGTFPNKRLVLDNDTEIEIFEKYWKYTTVTNKSGDYCIMGVPTGNQEVHVDIDLSDIGLLSQKPRDFVYKGYNIEQFDNASQFKESTNLDSLTQIFSQNQSVHVYPFWGEEDVEEIAITRCDMQIAYTFEPTCVFFGSIVSDDVKNSISQKCAPSKNAGSNSNLVAGEGTIEMIRKTTDGFVEEFPIQGNRLIDGNGVWCYQIPMNLDYVGMDEFGNIIPTDNPNKGIATRTSVRFRFSMQETENEGISRHRAKYLVPNDFDVYPNNDLKPTISNANKYDQCYEFGSSTPDEFFRDLYWNKVYTVKNYIPRVQKNNSATTQKYTGIKSVNKDGNFNPFPFNHARFKLNFSYRLQCLIASIVIEIVSRVNTILASIACFKPRKNKKWQPFKKLCNNIKCIALSVSWIGDDDDDTFILLDCVNKRDDNTEDNDADMPEDMACSHCKPDGNSESYNKADFLDLVQTNLAEEYDVVNLDFYNDWVNGILYFPLWFLKQRKKRSYLFGLIKLRAKTKYCDCDKKYKKIKLLDTCSMHYDNNHNTTQLSKNDYELASGGKNKKDVKKHNISHKNKTEISLTFGIIKEFINMYGKSIYYYSPGKLTNEEYKSPNRRGEDKPYDLEFNRLFATDIVLLGSLNNCDIDGLPQAFINLPSTTSNIPSTAYTLEDEDENSNQSDDRIKVEESGMDWMSDFKEVQDVHAKYGKGLLMTLYCDAVGTLHKSCVNLQRLSELGVSLDINYEDVVPTITDGTNGDIKQENEIFADGMITRYELADNETRAMFASLNHNGLVNKIVDKNTNYKKYDLKYVFPSDFDGHMSKYSTLYTESLPQLTYDNRNEEYIKFRFGQRNGNSIKYMYYLKNNNNDYQFPLYNNSFYFYFGLNQGNTAIDKFNNLFYSPCFQQNKEPISLFITTYPQPWCNSKKDSASTENDTESVENNTASVEIDVRGANTPFHVELYFVTKKETLCFEDTFSTKNFIIDYSTQDLEEIKRKENEIQVLDATTHPLINGDYKIIVSDSIGNVVEKSFTIEPSYISLNYTHKNLSTRYNGQDDITNIFNKGLNGEIVIESFNIDGVERKITSCTYNSPIAQIETEGGHNVKMVYSLNTNYEGSGATKYDFKDNKIIFRFAKPCKITLTTTLLCKGSETTNVDITVIDILNGVDFNAFINEVPLQFIPIYNLLKPNGFYWADYVSYKKSIEIGDSILKYYYFGIENNGDSYMFANQDYINIYQDKLSLKGYYNYKDGKNTISVNDMLPILKYQFECIFKMSKSTILVNNDDNYYFEITSNGGLRPITYCSINPEAVGGGTTDINANISNDGYYSCKMTYPDFINKYWCLFNSYNLEFVNINTFIDALPNDVTYEYNKNSLYVHPSYSKLLTEGINTCNALCVFSNKGKGDRLPSLVDEKLYNYIGTTQEWSAISGYTSYMFRGYFVDKRFGFNYKINVSNNLFESFEGKYSGGLSMKYEKLTFSGGTHSGETIYNVICDNTDNKSEYSYNGLNINYRENNQSDMIPQFYESYIKIDNDDEDKINLLENFPLSEEYQCYPKRNFNKFIEYSHKSCSYDIDLIENEGRLYGNVKPSETIKFKMNCNDIYEVSGYEFVDDLVFTLNGGTLVDYNNEQNTYTVSGKLDSEKISIVNNNLTITLKNNYEEDFEGDIFISAPNLWINNRDYSSAVTSTKMSLVMDDEFSNYGLESGSSVVLYYDKETNVDANSPYFSIYFSNGDTTSPESEDYIKKIPQYKDLCSRNVKFEITFNSNLPSTINSLYIYSYKVYMDSNDGILRKIRVHNKMNIVGEHFAVDVLNLTIKREKYEGSNKVITIYFGDDKNLFYDNIESVLLYNVLEAKRYNSSSITDSNFFDIDNSFWIDETERQGKGLKLVLGQKLFVKKDLVQPILNEQQVDFVGIPLQEQNIASFHFIITLRNGKSFKLQINNLQCFANNEFLEKPSENDKETIT